MRWMRILQVARFNEQVLQRRMLWLCIMEHLSFGQQWRMERKGKTETKMCVYSTTANHNTRTIDTHDTKPKWVARCQRHETRHLDRIGSALRPQTGDRRPQERILLIHYGVLLSKEQFWSFSFDQNGKAFGYFLKLFLLETMWYSITIVSVTKKRIWTIVFHIDIP